MNQKISVAIAATPDHSEFIRWRSGKIGTVSGRRHKGNILGQSVFVPEVGENEAARKRPAQELLYPCHPADTAYPLRPLLLSSENILYYSFHPESKSTADLL